MTDPHVLFAERAELENLVIQANGGDPAAGDRVTEMLQAHPDLWRRASDLAGEAETAWVAAIAGRDQLVARSLYIRLAEKKARLLAEGDSPLELLMIEQVICCWLQVKVMEIKFATTLADRDERRRGRADKHHTRAVLALAKVRKAKTRQEPPA